MKLFDPDGKAIFARSTVDTMMARARRKTEGEDLSVKIERLTEVHNSRPTDLNKVQIEIARVMAPLDAQKRKDVLGRIDREFQSELRRLGSRRAILTKNQDELAREIAAIETLQHWDPPMVLEPNTCSRLHHVKQRLVDSGKWDESHEVVLADVREHFLRVEHSFVVKHDWAGAFKNADGIEDVCRLPFDLCIFEFRVGGRTVMMLYDESTGPRRASMCIEAGPLWYFPPGASADNEHIYQFLDSQVRAICIALDSEVAEETVVRAPPALNKKRIASGKVPLADHHVVDLSRRHRIANPSGGEPTGRHVRLHFRRGHWRHYEAHRTWIKWMLVGDPALGYIQKHYAL